MPRAIQANRSELIILVIGLVFDGSRNAKLFEQFFGGFSWDDLAQFFEAGAADVRNAAKFAQELLRGTRTNAGNPIQCGACLAGGAALAVERYGKAMCLVANLLNEMKNGRMMLKENGLVLLAEDEENFFFFCDAGERLIDNLQRIEGLRGGMELADASVD